MNWLNKFLDRLSTKEKQEPDTKVLEYGRMRKFGATQEAYINPKAESDVLYWKGFCDGVKMQMKYEVSK